MKRFLTHLRYLTIIIICVSMMFLAMYVVNASELPTLPKIFQTLGWTAFYTIPLYSVNGFIYHLVERKLDGRALKFHVLRLLTGILMSCIVSVIIGGILFLLELRISGNTFQEAADWLFSKDSLKNIQQLIWISGTIACVLYILNFILKYQSLKIKEEKQKVVQISAEHESLKSQIGPHFLFNSLNVLNGLISENPDKAQTFVSELSSVYRYVLEQNDKALVPLKEEIDFSRTYMKLMQQRFEDGLEFEIVNQFNKDFQIVPLSLQILLENCIKHNRISGDETLKVKVYIENDYLLIENNLQIKNQLHRSTGKGLKNIIERYKSFTRKEVQIVELPEKFIVKLPLLTEKITTMETIQNYTKEELKAAKRRVEELQGFYWNLASYAIINIFFLFLDLRDGNLEWAFWPLLGWGIGVAFHAVEVFGMFNSASWKDRQVQKELERRKKERDRFFGNIKD
ncbi:MAG: histidine kinase [Moheibacter sp.]